VAGPAATALLLRRHAVLREAGAALKADTEDDVVARITKLQDTRADAARQWEAALATWAAMLPLPAGSAVERLPDDAPVALLRRRGEVLRTARPLGVHVLVRGGDVACATGSAGPSAAAVLAALLASLGPGGRSGGQATWAQGRLPPAVVTQPPAAVDTALRQALARVTDGR
jgi:hypothetical protein